jgi:hypothetical protein
VTEDHDVYLIKKIKINYEDKLLINQILLKDKIEKKKNKTKLPKSTTINLQTHNSSHEIGIIKKIKKNMKINL